MRSIGDADGGFTVAPIDGNGVVRVRAWGFWPPAIANAFADSLFESAQGGRKPTQIMIDAESLKPQREEGQAAFSAVCERASKFGGTRIEIFVTSSLTKLQLARITKEWRRKGVVDLKGGESV